MLQIPKVLTSTKFGGQVTAHFANKPTHG